MQAVDADDDDDDLPEPQGPPIDGKKDRRCAHTQLFLGDIDIRFPATPATFAHMMFVSQKTNDADLMQMAVAVGIGLAQSQPAVGYGTQ